MAEETQIWEFTDTRGNHRTFEGTAEQAEAARIQLMKDGVYDPRQQRDSKGTSTLIGNDIVSAIQSAGEKILVDNPVSRKALNSFRNASPTIQTGIIEASRAAPDALTGTLLGGPVGGIAGAAGGFAGRQIEEALPESIPGPVRFGAGLLADAAVSGGVGGLARRVGAPSTATRIAQKQSVQRRFDDVVPEGSRGRAADALESEAAGASGPGRATSSDVLTRTSGPDEMAIAPNAVELEDAAKESATFTRRSRDFRNQQRGDLADATDDLLGPGHADDLVPGQNQAAEVSRADVSAAYASIPDMPGGLGTKRILDYFDGLKPSTRVAMRDVRRTVESVTGRPVKGKPFQPKSATVGELEALRGDLGDMARDAWKAGKKKKWRDIKNLQEEIDGIYDDAIDAGTVDGVFADGVPELRRARSLRNKHARHFDDFPEFETAASPRSALVTIMRDQKRFKQLVDTVAERGSTRDFDDLRKATLEIVMGSEGFKPTPRSSMGIINNNKKNIDLVMGRDGGWRDLMKLAKRRTQLRDVTRQSGGDPNKVPAASAGVDLLQEFMISGRTDALRGFGRKLVRLAAGRGGVAELLMEAEFDPALMAEFARGVHRGGFTSFEKWARRVVPILERAGIREEDDR